ncbi:MAG: MerR family transcriptional regulator [Candidatus Methylomirabilales bacterium]
MREARFRPSQVAAEFNRSAEWLKHLERRGIIPKAQRDPLNGRRIYTREDIEAIRAALLCRTSESAGVVR